MIRLFFNKSGITARAIQARIREAGYECIRSKRATGATVRLNPDHTNVSYGASIDVLNPEVPLYNGVLPSQGKLIVLDRLAGTGLGIPFCTLLEGFQRGDTADWDSWLYRKSFGSKGRDIIFYRRGDAPLMLTDEYTFATQYIPKVAEFRAHVFGGEVLQVTRKKPEDPDVVAWNTGNDVVQHRIKNKIQIETIGNVAIAAINAQRGGEVGALFGAVDIIMDKYGRLYVLEINSAPALTVESRLNAYCEKILALDGIEHKYPEPEGEAGD